MILPILAWTGTILVLLAAVGVGLYLLTVIVGLLGLLFGGEELQQPIVQAFPFGFSANEEDSSEQAQQ